ncbi:flippase-like domain-containing protein [Winogradskyella sp. DF17]|uniref:Flippase-like domain-containing protein n=1 Tax=Winogradskyella pelagia TaxID=2819984 RepID=A0ABS3SYR2_9FLAO|nr:lysylphosphatidylglycerol synthase domain-containing protein [Winogradskyella sp. DF17]MBO3115620.1 flippase-like domain-containing protein [Winogradskyella sp. DF17]
MPYNVPHKTKQFFIVLIKLSIVVGAVYFIYSKLSENQGLELSEFLAFVKAKKTFTVKTVGFLILLSTTNWLLEIFKWQFLVKSITPISFLSALEQSLGGLTASLITPNRIGDYGAKAVYYAKSIRKKIVLLNLLGNMSQMAATVLFGIVGLLIFVSRYQIEIDYYKMTRFLLILLMISTFLVIGIKKSPLHFKGFGIKQIIHFLIKLPTSFHIRNLAFSIGRYLVFSFQFYYLLLIFGIEVDYFKAMVVITSMYFLASIIPTISIFDVVIKGSVAIFLFNYVEVNELTILSITTIMWLLNFAVPSLFGSYYVLNFKLPESY